MWIKAKQTNLHLSHQQQEVHQEIASSGQVALSSTRACTKSQNLIQTLDFACHSNPRSDNIKQPNSLKSNMSR